MMYDGHYWRQIRRESGVISATKEKQQRRQKVSGQFRKCHISSDLLREYTQGPWWVNGPSRQEGIITHPHLCSFFLIQYTAAALGTLTLSVASQIMAWHMCHLSTRLQTSWQVTHLFQFEVSWLVVHIQHWAYVLLVLFMLVQLQHSWRSG